MPEIKPSEIQFRELKFDIKPDAESRTFTIPVSSEASVERWWGTEILDHSPDAIQFAKSRTNEDASRREKKERRQK